MSDSFLFNMHKYEIWRAHAWTYLQVQFLKDKMGNFRLKFWKIYLHKISNLWNTICTVCTVFYDAKSYAGLLLKNSTLSFY